MNESQRRIFKYVLPINLIAVAFCVYCAIAIFTADKAQAQEKSKGLYFAGSFIQGYFIYIVVRDLLLTLTNFISGRRESFALLIAMHYSLSCMDNLFMTGLAIWGAVALSSESTKDFQEAPEEAGLKAFVAVTTLNVIMGFLYVCTHICAVPVAILVVASNPERFGFAHQPGNWHDEDIHLELNTELAETIR